MMHHTNLASSQPHQRHLRFQDENAFQHNSSNNNNNTTTKGSKGATPFKPLQDVSNGAAKTPKQKTSSRRAFGDISNKKRSHHHPSASGKGGPLGQPQQPTVQKLHLTTTQTNNKSVKKASRSNSNNNNTNANSKQVSFVLSDRTNVMAKSHTNNTNKINNNNSHRSAPAASATQNAAPSSSSSSQFDLTGLDPVEQPAGRTWSEQERWENDFGTETLPPRLDMNQVFANRRAARQLEDERIETEGWALLQQEMEQMHIQDEKDLHRMSEEFYKTLDSYDDDDSFDALLQSRLEEDNDDCFLNVSF